MTVVHLSEQAMGPSNRPAWCEVVGMGNFRIRPESMFDRHYHDSPEYWLFYEGKGKVVDLFSERFECPLVLCTADSPLASLLRLHPDWRTVEDDGSAVLFRLSKSPSSKTWADLSRP